MKYRDLYYLQGFYANGNNLVDFPEQITSIANTG